MAKSTKVTTKFKAKSKPESFIWTDDEVELLLKVTGEYKVGRTAENVDWESCQSKYSDILGLFMTQYPSAENAEAIGKDFPHKKEEITKIIITTKLKAIRSKFRAAVDSGRKSGHGRVVLLYFESCEAIWGGSPATSTIHAGLASTDITEQAESRSSSPAPASPESSTSFESERIDTENPESEVSQEKQRQESTVIARRDLLNAKLRGHKQDKLKRKLSTDAQLLSIAQEEMQMKKRVLDKMDHMDKEHSDHMKKLNTSMEQLTGSIADGFAMLREMMQSSALPAQYTPQHSALPAQYTPPQPSGLSAPYTPPGPSYHEVHDGYNLTPLQPRRSGPARLYPKF